MSDAVTHSSRNCDTLAPGWALAAVGTILDAINGRAFKSTEWKKSGTPIIRIQNLKDADARFNYFVGTLEEKHKIRAGDLLFAWSGTPGTSFGAHIWKGGDAALNQHIFRIDFDGHAFNATFLCHALNQNVAKYIEQAQGGVGLAHITKSKFTQSTLRIPPVLEQHRIVDRLEELFSRIEEGERALERVQKLVERYRQSVLKAAVTGELTRAWREAQGRASVAGGRTPEATEQHKGKLESGEALLQRILKARRAAWEKAELDKMKAKGQKPANEQWKQKYQEPTSPNTTDLPTLPEGWTCTSLGQLFRVSIGSTPSRKEPGYWGGNIPWVSSGEVAFCRIKSTRETISELGYENSSVKLHPKGTVMLAMIGEGKTRGQAAILDIDACHNQNAASIAVSATPIPPDYVYNFLRYRYEIVRGIGQGGNQPALNGDLIKGIAIPLPPLEEIVEICEAIDRQFVVIATIEADLAAQRPLINAQRQTILRDAFNGALVRQDPTDEPASVLLKRIAAERGAVNPAPKRGRKSGKPA